MARAVYPHEITDPDFCWLIERFQELRPEFVMIDSTTLPVVLFIAADSERAVESSASLSDEEIAEADFEEGDIKER